MKEPITVVFAAQKGGVGKTAMAVHCADAWARRMGAGTVQLIDADFQQNAVPYLSQMPQVLAENAPTVRVRVMDTPPTLEGDLTKCLLQADWVVVPVCRKAGLDALPLLNEVLRQMSVSNPRIKTKYVLMRHLTGALGESVERDLRAQNDLEVLAGIVHERRIYERVSEKHRTLFELSPRSVAAREMQAVCDELFEKLNLGE